jgi:hypothetical protein
MKKEADWKFGCLPIRPNLQPTSKFDLLLDTIQHKDLFYILADTDNIFKVQICSRITRAGYSQKSFVLWVRPRE